ncbi:hypothetical protein SH501x_005327 [Pirellulaceae bacterium SH501]
MTEVWTLLTERVIQEGTNGATKTSQSAHPTSMEREFYSYDSLDSWY